MTDKRGPSEGQHRQAWAEDVAVSVDVLRLRLLRAQHRLAAEDAELRTVLGGVEALLDRADKAVGKPGDGYRLRAWWRGSQMEAAYLNLHAAEAEMVALHDDAEVEAEIPKAAARLESGLHRDDPRRATVQALWDLPPGSRRRAALRTAVEVGHGLARRRHTRVRAMRNVVLLTSLLLAACCSAVLSISAVYPEVLAVCAASTADPVCPTGGARPSAADVGVVLLVGALGGALGAAVSLRGLRGTSTPYNLPIALSVLKLPAGALTALAGLLAVQGQFVPGLSRLNSPEQVLGYALVLGYAQQLLTRRVDDAAHAMLDDWTPDAVRQSGEAPRRSADVSMVTGDPDALGHRPARVNYRGTVGALLHPLAGSGFLLGRLEIRFWPQGVEGPPITTSGPVSVQDGTDAEHATFELTLLVDGRIDVYPRTQTARVPVRHMSEAFTFTLTRGQPDAALLPSEASRQGASAVLLDISQGGRSLQVLEINQLPVRGAHGG